MNEKTKNEILRIDRFLVCFAFLFQIDEKELAQLLSSVNSCSYQSACTQLQYPSVHAISSDTTDQVLRRI